MCRYYTVCRHVEAYTLGRLSIDGFSFERVAQSNLEWIFSNLDSGFQSLVGFRIPSAGFRIPKPRIPDSTSKKFLDSGIRIPLHGAKSFEKCPFQVASEQFPSVDMVEELEDQSLECEKFFFLLRTKTNSLEQIDYPSLELFSQSELIF